MSWRQSKRDLTRIRAEAAEWIARRDAGLRAEEEKEFSRWRAADVRHERAVAEFDRVWREMSRPRRTGSARVVTERLSALRRRDRMRWQSAALLLMVGVASWGTWTLNERPAAPLAAPHVTAKVEAESVVMHPERRRLADGSAIELSPGSEVAVELGPTLRRVTLLRGEAHFEVAKDPTRPFVVLAGAVEVRAIGTAFSVGRGAAEIAVLVTEGTVSVHRPTPEVQSDLEPRAPEATVLSAGNALAVKIAPRSSGQEAAPPAIAVTPVAPAEIARRLEWRSPRVEFSGTPLREVVAVLNGINATRLVIEDPALASVPLSGLFRADDVTAFVRILEQGFSVRATARGANEIVLAPTNR